MQEGYTTSGGLGMGLPGSKRLMDELDVQSELEKGTTVTVRKWKRA
jgi:serine/threonine-protein kinase RsbT